MKYYGYDLRADKYNYAANSKSLMKIQEWVQKRESKFMSQFKINDLSDTQKANLVLDLYLRTAYEEGFIQGLKSYEAKHIKILRRGKNKFAYNFEKDDLNNLSKVIKKRNESKRMVNARSKYCEDNSINSSKEMDLLSAVIHTGYEYGFIKASSDKDILIESIVKEDNVAFIKQLFNEVFPKNI